MPKGGGRGKRGGDRAEHDCPLLPFFFKPWFGIAVVVAMLTKADPGKVDDLALLFIGARVLYIGFYLANMSSARTLAWLGGFITTIVIFASGG